MSDSSLNISGKIDSGTVALYEGVSDAASRLEIPFVVVGASARDIVLHYGHDARIQRATTDVDFGIQVPDWSAFDALKESLLENGYSETRALHRVVSPGDVQVDIVPFGQVEDEEFNIAWPPDGDRVMNVLGFQEVCDNAEIVRIQDDPPVDIPVATPEGLAVLKLIAWADRTADLRGKDAKDLLYLFTTYEKIPTINSGLHEDQDLMEYYDWDIELASAYQLGVDAESIAEDQTYDAIASLFNGEHESLSVELLVEEMCEQIDREYERNEKLTNTFIDGFLNEEDSDDE
jgi:predicted nucleotidyltransferase